MSIYHRRMVLRGLNKHIKMLEDLKACLEAERGEGVFETSSKAKDVSDQDISSIVALSDFDSCGAGSDQLREPADDGELSQESQATEAQDTETQTQEASMVLSGTQDSSDAPLVTEYPLQDEEAETQLWGLPSHSALITPSTKWGWSELTFDEEEPCSSWSSSGSSSPDWSATTFALSPRRAPDGAEPLLYLPASPTIDDLPALDSHLKAMCFIANSLEVSKKREAKREDEREDARFAAVKRLHRELLPDRPWPRPWHLDHRTMLGWKVWSLEDGHLKVMESMGFGDDFGGARGWD